MKKYIFAVFAVAAVLSSCSKNLELNEDINSEAKAITTIGASTEISTRAVVSSSDDTKVNWETGDQLGVLGANGSSEARNLAYELTAGTGSTIGAFQNNSSDITTISAIMYPYQENAIWDGTNSKLTCEIPSVQTAKKGSFDKNAAVMYSIGNTTNVKLNFAVNFLKVTISETETNVHAISISSSDALSGKMEITSSGVTAAASGSLKSVTLTAEKGQFLTAGDYYIAVNAGNIENPTISYVYLNQTNHTATEKSKVGSGTLSFTSGKNVKPISVTNWTGAAERNAVQLWADGPYFAEYNVGVTDGKAESYGGYYAWGGNQDKVDDHNTTNDGSGNLSSTDDTATKLWGSNWRMPTQTDLQELLSNCTVEWTQVNSVNGCKFTGKGAYASNSVFLPAAGRRYGGSVDDQGTEGGYWSSTPEGSPYAYDLDFDSGGQLVDYYYRGIGYSVRAVLAEFD